MYVFVGGSWCPMGGGGVMAGLAARVLPPSCSNLPRNASESGLKLRKNKKGRETLGFADDRARILKGGEGYSGTMLLIMKGTYISFYPKCYFFYAKANYCSFVFICVPFYLPFF